MNFKTVSNGMCEGFVILKRCEEKKTKNGSDYLDAVIADNTGEMSAKKSLCDSGQRRWYLDAHREYLQGCNGGRTRCTLS